MRYLWLAGLLFFLGVGVLAYGVYLWRYRHPADYTEARAVVSRPSSTAAAGTENPAPAAAGDTLVVEGHVFNVDVADTIPKQAQGLSGREKLKDDQGMLFIFNPPRKEWFWMYDMKFSIDVIWIRNGVVAGVSPNLPMPLPGQASSTLPSYASPGVIDQVLEINAGLASKYGIQAGDTVEVHLKN